mmetsp:Transcript_17740/g.26871  ORF Transcript_17740/g.26871 Transcript_17740/m.26871 type:complete len:575 (+) Transcript_17740:32-1756(+)
MTDNGSGKDKKLYMMAYSGSCPHSPIKYSFQSKQNEKSRHGIPDRHDGMSRSRTDSETHSAMSITASTSTSFVFLEEDDATQGCRSDDNICQSISNGSSVSPEEFENKDGGHAPKFGTKMSAEYPKYYEEGRDEVICENIENKSDPVSRTYENPCKFLPTDAEAWLAGGKRELMMQRSQNDEIIHESNSAFPVLETRSSVSSPEATSLRNKLQNRILKRQEIDKLQRSRSDLSPATSKKATYGSIDRMKEILRTSSSDSQPTSPTSDSGLSTPVDPHEKRKVPDTNSNGGPDVLLHRLHRTVRYSRIGELPQQRREYANTVRLHVYDLLSNDTIMQLPFGCDFPIGKCFVTINDGLHAVGTGAYHCGIEVNGVEYAFGANETVGSTGVFTCVPRRAPGYEYRATIDFGSRVVRKTQWVNVRRDPSDVNYLSKGDSYVYRQVESFLIGRQLMKEMAYEYRGTDYDLLRKNCCTFAYDACLRLGIDKEEIPTWFKNLSDTGAQTQTIAQSAMSVFSMTNCYNLQEKSDPRDVQVGGFEVVRSSNGIKVIDIEKQAEVKISRGVSEHGVRRTLSWTY